MPTLNHTNEEKYFSNKGEKCVFCESGNDQIRGRSARQGDSGLLMRRPASCGTCNSQWTEIFCLIGLADGEISSTQVREFEAFANVITGQEGRIRQS